MAQTPIKEKESIISTIKEWASPSLIVTIGMFLWRDLSELKTDVKLLLIQQGVDEVRIDNVESEVNMLKTYVFDNKTKEQIIQYPQQPALKQDETEVPKKSLK